MARTEQRLRVENLVEKAIAELSLDPEVLVAEFGPDQLVPVLSRPDGSALPAAEDLEEGEELPAPRPYVREEQAARLRKAERALAVLGRVNPLALEDFEAMEERHRFLAEQLDDLRRTRKDLVDIIADVDARVEQVFAEAYADVEVAFERVFKRLFPGGEGRLVLTEPGDWLTKDAGLLLGEVVTVEERPGLKTLVAVDVVVERDSQKAILVGKGGSALKRLGTAARLEMEGDRIVREERLIEGEIGRIRDVRVGPDGLVYLLNDESDGAVWRLEPVEG